MNRRMLRLGQRKRLGFGGKPRDSLFFSQEVITITPTVGAEVIANGDFANWTTDDPDDWLPNGESGGDPEVTERDPGQGHADTKTTGGAANFYHTIAVGNMILQPSPDPVAHGLFYTMSVDVTNYVSGTVSWYWVGGFSDTLNLSSAQTFEASGAVLSLLWLRIQNPVDVTIDNVSYKTTTDTMLLFTHTVVYGDFSIDITRTAGHAAGIVFNYTDDDNFASVVLSTNRMHYYKRVGGVFTLIGTYSYTYSAGATLTVTRHIDGTVDITYNSASIVTGAVATGLSGVQAGPMLIDASEVTMSNWVWDARTTT